LVHKLLLLYLTRLRNAVYLYDAVSGDLVASDTLLDAYPIVTAPYEGYFFIEVFMVDCEAGACETWTDSDVGF
jgi:hypothetical protein